MVWRKEKAACSPPVRFYGALPPVGADGASPPTVRVHGVVPTVRLGDMTASRADIGPPAPESEQIPRPLRHLAIELFVSDCARSIDVF